MDSLCLLIIKMPQRIHLPPHEILQPTFGAPNYELIILWMLNANEKCTWAAFNQVIKKSTLSKYLSDLKKAGLVTKPAFNHYQISSTGKKRFIQLSKGEAEGKLNYPPKVILKNRNYVDIILWMVYNNSACQWKDFTEPPLSINQSSLSKNLHLLLENEQLTKSDKMYQITAYGKEKYAQMLKTYDLDKQSLLDGESRRISHITHQALDFFAKYHIDDIETQFRFLQYVLRFPYDPMKELEKEENFWKILLYFSNNHPSNLSKAIDVDTFAQIYNIKLRVLNYFIPFFLEEPSKYQTKIFELKVNEKLKVYLRENEKNEKILRSIVENYITKLTYMHKLYEEQQNQFNIPILTLSRAVIKIQQEICQQYRIFPIELESSMQEFLPQYIQYLAYKIERESHQSDQFDKIESLIWQDIYQKQSEIINTDKVKQYYINSGIYLVLNPYFEQLLSQGNSELLKFIPQTSTQEIIIPLSLTNSAENKDEQAVPLEIHLFKAYLFSFQLNMEYVISYLETNIDFEQIRKNPLFDGLYRFLYCLSNFSMGNILEAYNLALKGFGEFPAHPLSCCILGIILGYNRIYRLDQQISDDSYEFNHLRLAINASRSDSIKARIFWIHHLMLFEVQEYSKALTAIEQAIALKPENFSYYLAKISVLLELNEYQRIIDLLNQMFLQFPKERKNISLKKSSILKKIRKGEEGMQIIENLLQDDPDDYDLYLHKALWQQYFNQREAAFDTMKNLLNRQPKNVLYKYTYGTILVSFEEYALALTQFEETLEFDLNDMDKVRILIMIGVCSKELEENKKAEQFLTQGIQLSNRGFCTPSEAEHWRKIGELYLKMMKSSSV